MRTAKFVWKTELSPFQVQSDVFRAYPLAMASFGIASLQVRKDQARTLPVEIINKDRWVRKRKMPMEAILWYGSFFYHQIL